MFVVRIGECSTAINQPPEASLTEEIREPLEVVVTKLVYDNHQYQFWPARAPVLRLALRNAGLLEDE